MEQILSTIEAMHHQEEAAYRVVDYLHHPQDQQQQERSLRLPVFPLHYADEDCRSKMAAWCYKVVDFCKYERETVEIAMSLLDRYLMSPQGASVLQDRHIFQLAAMTCLYTAVKVHETEAMDLNLMSNLSRKEYSPQQVEEMEASILLAIQWRVNPPTSMAFVRQFLELIIPTKHLDENLRQTAYEITQYQTELAVSEYAFIAVKPSTVAFCALMNSLESMGMDYQLLGQVADCLSVSIGLDFGDDLVLSIQNWLYESVLQQPDSSYLMSQEVITTNKSLRSNPRSPINVSPRSAMR
jgi:hypothetical protein